MSESKTELLKKVRDDVWNLTSSPLYAYRTENKYYPVLGEGSHDAKIMFVGEAPGKNEAETGRPFCGAAGRLCDEFLASINLDRKDVYITNIVKDRPPNNRDPLPSEIELYAPFLDRQIDIIKPKIISTFGRFSMQYLLDRLKMKESGQAISTLHGKVLFANTSYGKVVFIPLYHPAVALYKNSTKSILLEDFKVIKEVLEMKELPTDSDEIIV